MEASEKSEARKMEASYHRHDINDKEWALLELHLPGQRGQWGGIAQDNRRFINAVFWVSRTGAPWRDLPPDYGKWGSVHQRFIRWRRKGVWEFRLANSLRFISNNCFMIMNNLIFVLLASIFGLLMA